MHTGDHVLLCCLSTTEVYFCARPGPVPSEESLPQPTTAFSFSMRSQPPPAVLWSRHLSPPYVSRIARVGQDLAYLSHYEPLRCGRVRGKVSSHGVCVLLFGARTGKGVCTRALREGATFCAAERVWSVTALKYSYGMPDTPSQAREGDDKLSLNRRAKFNLSRRTELKHSTHK